MFSRLQDLSSIWPDWLLLSRSWPLSPHPAMYHQAPLQPAGLDLTPKPVYRESEKEATVERMCVYFEDEEKRIPLRADFSIFFCLSFPCLSCKISKIDERKRYR